MDEVFLTIDIDGKEYQCPNFVECTSFILKDESTNEIKILIGEKE